MANILKTKGSSRLNTYASVNRAIEEGVRQGWERAHKYMDTPGKTEAVEVIHAAVMNSLSDITIENSEEDGECGVPFGE